MESEQSSVPVEWAQAPAPEMMPKKKPGPCCVCKPTKRLRDDCIFNFEEEKCKDFIDAHKECMATWGYMSKKTETE